MAVPQSAMQGLAFDARSLDALRRDASHDPQAAVRQAAGQFEALFMKQLLASMRNAMPKSGMFDGPGHETYVGMLDEQLSQSLSSRPGGLADLIARQLARHIDAAAPAAQASAAATPNRIAGRPAASSIPQAHSQPARSPQSDFIDRMWPHAIAAQRATGVSAAFVVGQAALESGWGRHEIRHADGRNAHNLFGIKAGSGWKGATVDVATTEYVDGKATRVVERFRAYSSYAEAFRDWASLMSGHERYGPVLRAGRSPEAYANGMQRAGYATDPSYADKLERTINQTVRLRRLSV